MFIELCTSSIDDILIANNFPFSRLELNSALSCGGLTPSKSFVKKALEISNKEIICMIRLREGNFNYSENEIKVMYDDAESLLKLGIKGIVFGFLNEDRSLDIKNIKKFITLANKYKADSIFSRAIDVSDKYLENLNTLKSLGITRILTSGHEKDVNLGKENLILALKNKLPIIIGSGINEKNILEFINLGFKDFHGSFSITEKKSYDIDFGNNSSISLDKIKNIFK